MKYPVLVLFFILIAGSVYGATNLVYTETTNNVCVDGNDWNYESFFFGGANITRLAIHGHNNNRNDNVTISIRSNPTGADIISYTNTTNNLGMNVNSRWIWFDINDTVLSSGIYYLVLRCPGCDGDNGVCWGINTGTGVGSSSNAGSSWTTMSYITNYGYEYDYLDQGDNIGECSAYYNTTILNMSFYHETTQDILTGDVSVDLTDGITNLSFQNTSITNLSICSNSSLYLVYSGTVHLTTNNNLNKYYFTDEVYNGTTKHIDIYNYPYIAQYGANISTLQVELWNYDGSSYANIIGKLYRYYPQNHTYLLVQMDRSDAFGMLYYDVIEQNAEYRLDFYQGNTYKASTNDSMKFLCVNNKCYIRYQFAYPTASSNKIALNYSYNNGSRMLYLDYDDPTNTLSYLTLDIIQNTITGDTSICTTTSYTPSATLSCNLTAYTGQVLMRVMTSSSSPKYELFEYVDLGKTTLGGVVGIQESGFWTFGLSMTIAAVGLFSPVGVIMMFVASLWIIFLLGFSNIISVSFLVVATCIGVFISYKVKT